MTTESDTGPWWAGKTAGQVLAAAEARDEAWAPVTGFSRYEWSDKGLLRSLDCVSHGRQLRGQPMKTRPNNSGYLIASIVGDEGGRVTVAVAPMIVLAHHPPFRGLARFPAGLETRHGPAGPLCNAYPENLWPGDKLQNAADKDGPPEPQHPCRNYAVCGNLVHTEGKRCVPCTEAVGREAAALLDAGANLMTVAGRFGYTGPDWVYRLAVRHGGYEGTKAAALAQHPSLTQRARLRLHRRGDTP